MIGIRKEKIAQKFNAVELLQLAQLGRKKQISSKEVYCCALKYYKYLDFRGWLFTCSLTKKKQIIVTCNHKSLSLSSGLDGQ